MPEGQTQIQKRTREIEREGGKKVNKLPNFLVKRSSEEARNRSSGSCGTQGYHKLWSCVQ